MKCLLGVCTLLLATIAGAQTKVERIRIRVLDGHSGKPVKSVMTLTTLYPLLSYRYPIDVRTDIEGFASLLVPRDTQLTTVVRRHPVCQRRDRSQPDAPLTFAVADILSSGVVAPDSCGHRDLAAAPTEFVLFVRPLHWWERFTY